jgi:hypothetical protein
MAVKQERQVQDDRAHYFSDLAGMSTLLQLPAMSALTCAMATGHSHAPWYAM